MNIQNSETPPLILVVDDEQKNLQVLGNLLAEKRYRIDFAMNGEEGLELARNYQPDLILLDVMMPVMDGLEVCEKLKAGAVTKDIPVIFITAKHEDEDILRGFESGGVDYICKPFRTQELLARVHTHVSLVMARKRLEKANKELYELNEKKSEFLGVACHDLKNPLSGIVWHADILRESFQEGSISQGHVEEDDFEVLDIIENSAKNMLQIVNNVMDTEFLESGKVKMEFSPVDISFVAQQVLFINKVSAKKKNINLVFERKEKVFSKVDVSRIREIMDNLLSNAIKYSPLGKKVEIEVYGDENHAYFAVSDEGPGFSKDDKEKMYGKFARLSARPTGNEISTGLGLSIVKRLVELHDGGISLESEKGKGARFVVSLPRLANGDVDQDTEEEE
jgi:signal transduction histidine kinase